MTRVRAANLAALLCLAFLSGACSAGDAQFTGVVTTVAPRVCLGRPDASGDCFLVSNAVPSGVRVGDCVTVSYRLEAGPPGLRGSVTALERATGC